MPKHESRRMTLGEIINSIDHRLTYEDWYEMMQIAIYIPGLQEALDVEDFDKLSDIEATYIRAHENDVYLVSWPEHVTHPQITGDAIYQLQPAE